MKLGGWVDRHLFFLIKCGKYWYEKMPKTLNLVYSIINNSSIDLLSEVNLLHFYLGLFRWKNGIFKDFHDFCSSQIEVAPNFFLTCHIVVSFTLFRGVGLLNPSQKFLILLEGFNCIEGICFFAEKTVGCSLGLTWVIPVFHRI